MSYYWFNGQEILQKAKERYSKEKAAEYYLQNKKSYKKQKKDIPKKKLLVLFTKQRSDKRKVKRAL